MKLANSCFLVCFLAVTGFQVNFASVSEVDWRVVVATRTAPLKTKGLFKFSSQTSRGQRWAVVKEKKSSVILSWDPAGELAREFRQHGGGKLPQFTITREQFDASFVPLSEWAEVTTGLAGKMQLQYPELSLEDCERLVNGDLWVGLDQQHVLAAIPRNRITELENVETIDGLTEVWRVTTVDAAILTQNAAKLHVTESVLLGEPQKSVTKHHEDLTEGGTSMILTFVNGMLVQIDR